MWPPALCKRNFGEDPPRQLRTDFHIGLVSRGLILEPSFGNPRVAIALTQVSQVVQETRIPRLNIQHQQSEALIIAMQRCPHAEASSCQSYSSQCHAGSTPEWHILFTAMSLMIWTQLGLHLFQRTAASGKCSSSLSSCSSIHRLAPGVDKAKDDEQLARSTSVGRQGGASASIHRPQQLDVSEQVVLKAKQCVQQAQNAETCLSISLATTKSPRESVRHRLKDNLMHIYTDDYYTC